MSGSSPTPQETELEKSLEDFELDKKLYEVSGWNDTYFWWNKDEQRSVGKQMVIQQGRIFPDDIPHYDLEYVLAKLPRYIDRGKEVWCLELEPLQYLDGRTDYGTWQCNYWHHGMGGKKGLKVEDANTPRNAAIKLCLELFAKDSGLLQ